jgi:type II secretory pathway pseudopilin PulG
MRTLKEESGLGIIDTLVALMVIAVLIGVMLPRFERMAEEAREAALRIGLDNIQKAVTVYVLINHRIPSDLKYLMRERVIIPVREDTIFTTEYLKTLAVDEEGYPVDPFGNRYAYDSATGRVSSTTEGYEEW